MEGHLLEGELVDLLLAQAGEDPQVPLLQQLGAQELADCPTLTLRLLGFLGFLLGLSDY